MTVQTTHVIQPLPTAAAPRVNLMPPEIAESERLRQIQLACGGAVVLAIIVVVLLYLHEHSRVSSAQSQLAQAQAQQTSLQEKLTSLSSVQQTYAEVQARQALLSEAMGNEIRWSYILNDLSLQMPSNVALTSFSAAESLTPGQAPTISTPPSSIGTINFNGVALTRDDVATWLDMLATEHGFTDPVFTSAAEGAIAGRGYNTFTTSVTLTPDALSGAYASPTTTPAGE
ncbi:MAG TPA: PilN domain-containing protein [Mycobacteriales bacterium]|nr:PilN domain-containing protein [Mycobacteriales bacterium]